MLSALLEDPHCKLEKLKLCGCNLTEQSCALLASALCSSCSSLRELDLEISLKGSVRKEEDKSPVSSVKESPPSCLNKLNLNDNKPGDSGAKLCSAEQSDPQKIHRLFDVSHSGELNLSYKKLGDSGHQNCKLEILGLYKCCIKEEGCDALASALKSNPSHLRELNLNCNKPGESGVKLLSALREDPHNKLKKLDI
ncbi:hypothetical protein MHYP_G00086660 [Metynnis hypsauchen]